MLRHLYHLFKREVSDILRERQVLVVVGYGDDEEQHIKVHAVTYSLNAAMNISRKYVQEIWKLKYSNDASVRICEYDIENLKKKGHTVHGAYSISTISDKDDLDIIFEWAVVRKYTDRHLTA